VSDEAPEQAKPQSMMSFRSKKAKLPRLPAAMAKRQGEIATLAFRLLGGREGAISFLNSMNRTLGARPIDLAMASEEGFARVEGAIKSIAAGRGAG
jgi:uncharacterized protein (DUF2384 family)